MYTSKQAKKRKKSAEFNPTPILFGYPAPISPRQQFENPFSILGTFSASSSPATSPLKNLSLNTPPRNKASEVAADGGVPSSAISGVYSKQPNYEQLWLLITSLPNEKFIAELKNLSAPKILENFAAKKNPAKKLIALSKNIEEAIVGSNGVYYSATARGDMSNLAVHAYHIAHTIIYEKISSTQIKNADHKTKADNLLTSLTNILESIEEMIYAYTELSELLGPFQEYMSLQIKCLSVAINFYNHDTTKPCLPNTPITPGTRQILTLWHDDSVNVTPQRTPTKLDSINDSRINLISQYRSGNLNRKDLFNSPVDSNKKPNSLRQPTMTPKIASTLNPFSSFQLKELDAYEDGDTSEEDICGFDFVAYEEETDNATGASAASAVTKKRDRSRTSIKPS